MAKPYRKRRLNPRAQAVLKAAVEDRDRTLREIGVIAGIKEKDAASVAGRILRRPNIQERYRELMATTPGLRDQEILDTLAAGMNATKVERFADKGKVKTEKIDIDFPTRRGYAELAVKLNGALTTRMEVAGKDGAPLLPEPITKALEGMDEASLNLLLTKLATGE